MQSLTLTNSSVTATPSAASLSLAPDILSSLGFEDQRAEIIAEEQTTNHQYLRLRAAIEKFAVTPNAKNKFKLTQELNKEINRLQKEHDYIKAKQLEYQQAAAQPPSSSNPVTQWRDWFASGVKQFFGSDNAYQAQRYAAIAEARQEQIEKLKKYRDEVKAKNKSKQKKPRAVEKDVIELNTDDASPMRRRLLMLPVANEFRVNANITGSQSLPVIGAQSNSNFIIAWHTASNGDRIYSRILSSDGSFLTPDFQVSPANNNYFRMNLAIGVQPNNDFIVVWDSYTGEDGDSRAVYAQRVNATGFLLDSQFQVNSYTINDQRTPAIAVQPNGNFVCAWISVGQDGYGGGIYAQRFSNTGNLLGGEFQVNIQTNNWQDNPAVAAQSNGDFIIAWNGYVSNQDIYIRRYTANGVPITSEILINTYTASHQILPAIGVLPNDGFIVTWADDREHAAGLIHDIYAQQCGYAGNKIGSEFRVNTYTTNDQTLPKIGVQSTGSFIVVWQSTDRDVYGDVYAQRFSNTSAFLGTQFLANSNTIFFQTNPVIGILPDNSFAIAWYGNPNVDREEIYARIFRPLNIGNHTLTVNQGQNTTVTTSMIDATSGGTPSDVSFTVSNLANGRFEFSNNPGVAITQFNKQQIIDGIVRFVHDGSANAPSFSVSATDGNETLGPYPASINFTPAPAASSSTGIAALSSSSSGNAQSSSGNNAVSSTALASSTAASAGSSSATNGDSSSSANNQPPSSTAGAAASSSSGNAQSSSANNVVSSTALVSSTAMSADSSSGFDEKSSSSTALATPTVSSSSSSSGETETTRSGGLSLGARIGIGVGASTAALLAVYGIYRCCKPTCDEFKEFVGYKRFLANRPPKPKDNDRSAIQIGDIKAEPSSSDPVHTPPPMRPTPGGN